MQMRKFFILVFLVLVAAVPMVSRAAIDISATSTGAGLSNGLVGYWTMDGKDINWATNKLVDRSGMGYTATIVGLTKATSTVAGATGQALKFKGTDYVILASTTDLANPAGFTYAAWVYPQGSGARSIFAGGVGGALSKHPQLRLESSGVLTILAENSAQYSSSLGKVPNGRWSYVVFTFDGTTNRFNYYINGVNSTPGSNLVSSTFSAGTTTISRSDSERFVGGIDDVRIYNRVLSAAEVMQLYNMGAGNKIQSSPASVSPSGTSTTATSTALGLNSGLVGYWTMDGKDINWTTNKIIDRSGNGNTGTLVGLAKATSTVAGKVGQALRFASGKNAYVKTSDNGSLSPAKVTVSAWVYMPTASLGARQVFVARDHSGSAFAYYLASIYSTLSFEFCTSLADCAHTSSATLMKYGNKWVFLTGEFDGTNNYLFINGVLAATQAATAMDYTGNPYVYIGSYPTSASLNNSNNTLDDVRIYNRVLSPAEVMQLYNMGAATKFQSSPASTAPLGQTTSATTTAIGLNNGLVGYWTMDGKDINWTTNKIIDRSGNGNTGTLVRLTKATSTAAGKVGQGMKFDGSTNSINIGSDIIGSGAATVCAWVNPRGWGGGGYGRIVDNARTFAFVSASYNSGTNIIAFTSTGSAGLNTANNSVRLNVWTHFCGARYSSGVTNLYINGALSGAANRTEGVPVSGSSVVIGGRSADNARDFNGSIDDVRIYNRALSASEVQQLYNMGR